VGHQGGQEPIFQGFKQQDGWTAPAHASATAVSWDPELSLAFKRTKEHKAPVESRIRQPTLVCALRGRGLVERTLPPRQHEIAFRTPDLR
jgi:hypothetical protein